jgi:hypothetical protein
MRRQKRKGKDTFETTMASPSSSSEQRSFAVAVTATVAKNPILAAYDAVAIETEVCFVFVVHKDVSSCVSLIVLFCAKRLPPHHAPVV